MGNTAVDMACEQDTMSESRLPCCVSHVLSLLDPAPAPTKRSQVRTAITTALTSTDLMSHFTPLLSYFPAPSSWDTALALGRNDCRHYAAALLTRLSGQPCSVSEL